MLYRVPKCEAPGAPMFVAVHVAGLFQWGGGEGYLQIAFAVE